MPMCIAGRLSKNGRGRRSASAVDSPSPAPTAPSSYKDPAVFGVIAVAAAILVIPGFDVPLERDAALFAYGASQVLEGVPPYESVFTRTGPLGHLLPVPGALAARLLDFDQLVGMRVIYFALSVLAVGIMYLLGRDLFQSKWAGAAAAAALLSFDQFLEYATAGPREKTAMVLFVVAALWAAVGRRWLTAGVLGALAGLTWQPSVLVLLSVIAAAGLRTDTAGRWRPLRNVILGAALPVAITLTYFAVEGALKAALDGFFLAHLRYTTPIARSLVDRLVHAVDVVRNGYPMSALIMAVGLAAMVVMAIWRIRIRTNTKRLRDDRFLVVLLAFALSMAWTLFDLQGAPDLMLILPYAALGTGFLAHLFSFKLSGRFAVLAFSVIIGTILALGISTSLSAHSTSLTDQQRSVAQIVAQLPPGAELVSMGAPQPLLLGDRTNPTRYLIVTRGLRPYLEDTWPGGVSGFVDDFIRDPPEAIALDRTAWQLKELRTWLSRHYVQRGQAPRWTWYVHESIADDVVPGTG
jgi:4-amino-4-deoxy-L-arabinose transferase-like glycosyltransferase